MFFFIILATRCLSSDKSDKKTTNNSNSLSNLNLTRTYSKNYKLPLARALSSKKDGSLAPGSKSELSALCATDFNSAIYDFDVADFAATFTVIHVFKRHNIIPLAV